MKCLKSEDKNSRLSLTPWPFSDKAQSSPSRLGSHFIYIFFFLFHKNQKTLVSNLLALECSFTSWLSMCMKHGIKPGLTSHWIMQDHEMPVGETGAGQAKNHYASEAKSAKAQTISFAQTSRWLAYHREARQQPHKG